MRFPGRPKDTETRVNFEWLETGQFWDFTENPQIGNPDPGTLRVHAEDNGAGKSRLVVRDSNGASFVIWTQP